MDILVIFVIAIVLFAVAMQASKFVSLWAVWKKAKKHGLSPSIAETIALTKFFALEDFFLEACAQFKQLNPDISIKAIVHHHMADGDTLAFLSKMKSLKQEGLEVPFESAVLYDLSGKDLLQIAQQQNKIYELSCKGTTDNRISYHYHCQFTISMESAAWISPDLSQYEWEVSQKIKTGIQKTDDRDARVLTRNVLEEYVNELFWKDLCHGHVIHQDLKIVLP